MGLAKLEKFLSNTEEEYNKLIKIFVSQALNMCFLYLIANLNLDSVEFIHEWHTTAFGRLFFAGLHPDFTRFWYINVGVSILVLKTVNIVLPQILAIIFMVPACALRRICCAHKARFQYLMNKYYEGLNVNLWDRHASILVNTFFAMTFSSGMPLLLPLNVCLLLVQYWIDKILLVKYAKKPPPYGMTQQNLTFNILPFALCLHFFIGFFVFTCPQIYSLSSADYTSQLNVTDTRIYEGQHIAIEDRINSVLGLPSVFGFFVSLVFAIMHPWIIVSFMSCCETCKFPIIKQSIRQ